MATKVKELDNRHDGPRDRCPICTPPNPAKRITANELWNRMRDRNLKGPSLRT